MLADAQRALEERDYATALDCASGILDNPSDPVIAAKANIIIARLHLLAGNREAAMIFANEATDLDPSNPEARSIVANEMPADSTSQNTLAMELYNNLYEHDRQLALETQRRFRIHLAIGICLLLSLAILLSAIFYAKTRHRHQIKEMQQKLSLAADELRSERINSQSQITRLFRESFESLEANANLLIDSRLSKNKSEMIIRQFEETVMKCRSDQFLSKLKNALNSTHNGIIDSLIRDLPSINQSELTVALYCAAGLSARVICLLLDCTSASLYNRKYRLRRRIMSAELSDAGRQNYLHVIFGE